MLFAALTIALAGAGRLGASDPGTGDWPMWGGTPDRNMVSSMKGLPTDWDVKTNKNIKWVAKLGSQSYGNPVVAGGMVFVGTNNENEELRDPNQPGDRGVLMAFSESTGELRSSMTSGFFRGGNALVTSKRTTLPRSGHTAAHSSPSGEKAMLPTRVSL